jgi:hypothetical protein
MLITETFNNQFRLYHYISNLNINIIQYFENNNIDLNYYCFFVKIIDNAHHIITSDITKRKDNGYKLIIIEESEKDGDNYINQLPAQLVINFENIFIKISSIYGDINDSVKYLDVVVAQFNGNKIKNRAINYAITYDKNVLETNVNFAHNVLDCNNLRNLPNLISVKFAPTYDQIIGLNCFSLNIQYLYFGHDYNQIIKKFALPKHLHTLTFGDAYNRVIDEQVLPKRLDNLIFGYAFNQVLNINVLPPKLKNLKFGGDYNQTLEPNVLPSSLYALTFGDAYNQQLDIGVLPINLRELTFGYDYNQQLDIGVLPLNLCTLVFGMAFNKKLAVGVLPPKLLKLTFKYSCNLKIAHNALPQSLQSIYFEFYSLSKSNSNFDSELWPIYKNKNNILPLEFRAIAKKLLLN